jgi:molybdopterin converting factor subunit 1
VQVRVLLFASLRETAGRPELAITLPSEARVSTVLEALAEALPSQRALLSRSAFAINAEYAGQDDPVHEQDVIAVIPPVSGGT